MMVTETLSVPILRGTQSSKCCLPCLQREASQSRQPCPELCHMPRALMVSLQYCGRYQVPELLTHQQQVPNCLFFGTRCSFKTKLHVNPQVPAYSLQPLAMFLCLCVWPPPLHTQLLSVSEVTWCLCSCAVVQWGTGLRGPQALGLPEGRTEN